MGEFEITLFKNYSKINEFSCDNTYDPSGVAEYQSWICVFDVSEKYLPVIQIYRKPSTKITETKDDTWGAKFYPYEFEIYGDFRPERYSMKLAQSYLVFAAKYSGN